MAKTTNSPCPPGANDKIASTGSAKFNIKTIAKTEVVRNSSSKLKPKPANISMNFNKQLCKWAKKWQILNNIRI